MATNELQNIYRELLTQRMNSLAREIVDLKPDDPRRAEIVKEMSRLSLLGASSDRKLPDVKE